jgi:hypothetical protein
MKQAGREFEFSLTAEDKAVIKQLRADRSIGPNEKEDRVSTIRAKAKARQKTRWHQERAETKHWTGLVKLYVIQRERFNRLPLHERSKAAAALERDYNTSKREALLPEAKAHARAAADAKRAEKKARTEHRRELKQTTIKLRRQFGWRQRGHGRTAWTQHARASANPEQDYQEYGQKCRAFWDEIYSERPALLEQDQVQVCREVLRDHDLTKLPDREEWTDARTAELAGAERKYLANQTFNPGVSNIGVDELKTPMDELTEVPDHEEKAMLQKVESEMRDWQKKRKTK